MSRPSSTRNPFLLQPSSDETNLTDRTAALTLKTEPNDAGEINTEHWTRVRSSRRPTRSRKPENAPLNRDRWSEQTGDDSPGPTPILGSNPFLTVVNDRTSEKYVGDAQASCYSG